MPKFVQRDQSQRYLMPPDLRDWLPEDDLAHFEVEAVERVSMSAFEVNERGTGSAQYQPRTMLALLVYCYANGIFGSRRLERATYRDIGLRYVAANCHPDHDTTCTFRCNNFDAVAGEFVEVLQLAKELELLRVGTASVDGTKLDANANKRNSFRYDRAGQLREQLRIETGELLGQPESADRENAPDPQGLPEELSRRENLRAKLDHARAQLERCARGIEVAYDGVGGAVRGCFNASGLGSAGEAAVKPGDRASRLAQRHAYDQVHEVGRRLVCAGVGADLAA